MDSSNDPWLDRAEKFDRHPVRESIKWGLAVLLVGLTLAVIISLITTGAAFFNAGKAKVTNPARVQQQVYQPSNTITQVAFFHNTCNDVRAGYVQWQNNQTAYQADLAASRSATDPIRQQQAVQALTQDQQNVNAVANQMANAAEDYNSRSHQYTANAFKDAGLPDQINVPPASQLSGWQPPAC